VPAPVEPKLQKADHRGMGLGGRHAWLQTTWSMGEGNVQDLAQTGSSASGDQGLRIPAKDASERATRG
jgi:hypothetical protein